MDVLKELITLYSANDVAVVNANNQLLLDAFRKREPKELFKIDQYEESFNLVTELKETLELMREKNKKDHKEQISACLEMLDEEKMAKNPKEIKEKRLDVLSQLIRNTLYTKWSDPEKKYMMTNMR